MEVAEKQANVPSLIAAPYNASIDKTLSRNLLFMGKLDSVAPNATTETLTEEQLKNYVKSQVSRSPIHYEPAHIEQALSLLAMQM